MKIWLVDLEAVETRYTKQWKTEFPKLLKARGHKVEVVNGGDASGYNARGVPQLWWY